MRWLAMAFVLVVSWRARADDVKCVLKGAIADRDGTIKAAIGIPVSVDAPAVEGAGTTDDELFVTGVQALARIGFKLVDKDYVGHLASTDWLPSGALVWECGPGKRSLMLQRYRLTLVAASGAANFGVVCESRYSNEDSTVMGTWSECPVEKDGTIVVSSGLADLLWSVAEITRDTAFQSSLAKLSAKRSRVALENSIDDRFAVSRRLRIARALSAQDARRRYSLGGKRSEGLVIDSWDCGPSLLSDTASTHLKGVGFLWLACAAPSDAVLDLFPPARHPSR